MQGILYLQSVPKLGVVAPTNMAKNKEKQRQYIIAGSFQALKKLRNPDLRIMLKVSNISARLSKEESKVLNFRVSHKKGRYKVAIIAAGAIFIRLVTDPSNSTPKSKFDPAISACAA